MLPKELAVAEAWLLAMLLVERARAFMIFPTFVLVTLASALKSAFQVIAAHRLVFGQSQSAPTRHAARSPLIRGTGHPAETLRRAGGRVADGKEPTGRAGGLDP